MGQFRFRVIYSSMADVFYLGGHLRLESFCILVNIVHFKMCKCAILHCKISNMGRKRKFFGCIYKSVLYFVVLKVY